MEKRFNTFKKHYEEFNEAFVDVHVKFSRNTGALSLKHGKETMNLIQKLKTISKTNLCQGSENDIPIPLATIIEVKESSENKIIPEGDFLHLLL